MAERPADWGIPALHAELLLGQDRRSRSLAGKALAYPADRDADPLLRGLCCEDWHREPLYEEIDAPEAKSVLDAPRYFPFLGDRLLALQDFVRLLQPYDWRTLWYDRRDMNRFLGVWAVIFFGLLTLVLAGLGILLAAAHVAGSFNSRS